MIYLPFAITAVVLFIWTVFMRIIKKKKVNDAPLGLPKGTIRATISLYLLVFSFGYLLDGEAVPSILVSSVFVVMAFYFEQRSGQNTTKELYLKITNPDKLEKVLKPLYLPKYSVRLSLLGILIAMILYNTFGPNIMNVSESTLRELLIIISFFLVGMMIGGIGTLFKKRRVRKVIKENPNITEEEVIKKFSKEDGKQHSIGHSMVSILTYTAVLASIVLFIMDIDWTYDLILFTFSTRQTLLYTLNIYFGFRN